MRKISLIRAPSGFSFSSGNLSTHPEEEAEDRGSDRDDTRNNDNKKRTNVGENTDDDDNDDNDDESQDPSSSSAASSNNASTTHREGGAEENSSTDDDSNSNTMSKNNSSQCEYNQIREFASEETKRVQLWRMIVIGSILIAGALISTVSYLILRSPFHNDTTANDSFQITANYIEDTLHHQIHSLFESNRELSRYVTLSGINSVRKNGDNDFPYVAVPSFEVQAHTTRYDSGGGIDVLFYAPIVSNFTKWVQFTNETKHWLEESKYLYDKMEPGNNRSNETPRMYLPPVVYKFDNVTGQHIVPWFGTPSDQVDDNTDTFCPRLYTSPPPYMGDGIVQNEDLFSNRKYKSMSDASIQLQDIVFSDFFAYADTTTHWDPMNIPNEVIGEQLNSDNLPHSIVVQPVYKRLGDQHNNDNPVVGFIFNYVAWESYLSNTIKQENMNGVYFVLKNSCNQDFTFRVQDDILVYVGEGDSHDHSFDKDKKSIDFSGNYIDPGLATQVPGHCQIYLDVYPSVEYDGGSVSKSTTAIMYTTAILLSFVVMAIIFLIYDRFVRSRNEKVVIAAARSNAIVSSLFPSNVRARLLAEKGTDEDNTGKGKGRNDPNRSTLKGFLAGETQQDTEMQDADVYKSKPIADLFPETTVMFGDIVGFTAWSSVREPSQVFTLLETIYHAFDEIARKRRVFKVETVGDCYVAVCGLPDPRKDHAVNMCRFARDCMYRMWALTKSLEVVLGPDTGELSIRVGLHSGPVTAGVLRGERSRFQLFGDTMNTAARMESNGQKSRIHLSQETADLLIAAGKSVWVTARSDKIIAKGKGEMQTYWLEATDKLESGSSGSGPPDTAKESAADDTGNVTAAIAEKTGIDPGKTERLIDWNVEVLLRLLKHVVGRRRSQGVESTYGSDGDDLTLKPARGQTVLDEVKEIITLPKFDSASMSAKKETESVEMSPKVAEQLHDYVWNIASMYRNNPFHNFEHASHVTMSVIKLLSRIVAPSENDCAGVGEDASSLHDHTYGITSDPLTQFSCVLSALIHDLDHPGVPNAQLVKERSQLASTYRDQSVAEQNSVDIAWHLLMDERYDDLRNTIYTDEVEMRRFRQLVVNSVMATDIVDKELKNLRNARWEKAFSDVRHEEDVQVTINRKATIVIEHLIQASDVAHTMQHWHIYRKWNERFFMECYKAYKDGRAETDPSTNWYNGEIGFFDFYIIPLAKKLKNCGVFGVSSDEYLNYAIKNRQEWEQRGQDVVAEMIEKVNSIWGKDAI